MKKYTFKEEVVFDENGKKISATYYINDVNCCSVKRYFDYYCSLKNGELSINRNTLKVAKSTSWYHYNLKLLTGFSTESINDHFESHYPNLLYGNCPNNIDRGKMISFKEFQEIFTQFIKNNSK